jgi:hypothetical protein
VKDMNIRASVRTDVWALLRRYDEALDKMSQYVSEILWRQRDFLALLALRIQASSKQLGVTTPPVAPSARQEDIEESGHIQDYLYAFLRTPAMGNSALQTCAGVRPSPQLEPDHEREH